MAKNMRRCESASQLVQGIQCIVWKDNKAVTFLNNVEMKQGWDKVTDSLPWTVSLCNKYIWGVDVYDSRRKTYSCSHKSKKWWMRIYYFLLDTAITNAHVLYKDSLRTKKTTHQEFVFSMIIHLLGAHSSRKWQSCSQPPPAGCLQRRHFQQGVPVLYLPREKENDVRLQKLLCWNTGSTLPHTLLRHLQHKAERGPLASPWAVAIFVCITL